MFLYPLLDNKYKLSNKIDSKLKGNKYWKPVFITVSSLIFILILGIIGIYFINIPDMLYFSICGIIAGVASKITISNKING
ncbi:hypothetical protein SH2C18_31350 [Clostridium sediminicola]